MALTKITGDAVVVADGLTIARIFGTSTDRVLEGDVVVLQLPEDHTHEQLMEAADRAREIYQEM